MVTYRLTMPLFAFKWYGGAKMTEYVENFQLIYRS